MGDDGAEGGRLLRSSMPPIDPQDGEPGRREDDRVAERPGRVSIERNGQEYLVTINGAAFVALSRAQAEGIARRMRGGTRPLRVI
ncbi:MAG: hypothetical protein IT293_14690 [Deltaproteobacteria bacterium]|nr:hypothetical protein [Deltaproteobacteria bacterium]